MVRNDGDGTDDTDLQITDFTEIQITDDGILDIQITEVRIVDYA